SLCVIGGGCSNLIKAETKYSTISGGFMNLINGNYSSQLFPSDTIEGGDHNTVQGTAIGSSIGGGTFNLVNDSCVYSVVSAGWSNQVTAPYGTIPGGVGNTASTNAFAAGTHAWAAKQGTFVWADNSALNFPFKSLADNEFAVRATGGARFVSAVDGYGNPTAGVALASGATSWSTLSDRNAKKDFAPVNTDSVLDKLDHVPVEQWRYKWEPDCSTPHIGPMAQDFKHAFYPGRDDKSITTLEFDGVELAAIEGLNTRITQESKAEDARLNDFEKRLE